jgi:hypothetical protein
MSALGHLPKADTPQRDWDVRIGQKRIMEALCDRFAATGASYCLLSSGLFK